jgi:hypothetical protein
MKKIIILLVSVSLLLSCQTINTEKQNTSSDEVEKALAYIQGPENTLPLPNAELLPEYMKLKNTMYFHYLKSIEVLTNTKSDINNELINLLKSGNTIGAKIRALYILMIREDERVYPLL